MITFQGNFKYPVSIQKRCSLKLFKESSASFVELDPSSIKDMKMLRELSSIWQDSTPGGTYAVEISEMFKNAYLHAIESTDDLVTSTKTEAADRFFAITTQKQDYENLEPDRILGLAKTTKEETNEIWLDFLQVNPDTYHQADYPMYKRVGTAIINSLTTLFKGKRIELLADLDAIPFYEKLGFKKVKNGKQNQLYIDA